MSKKVVKVFNDYLLDDFRVSNIDSGIGHDIGTPDFAILFKALLIQVNQIVLMYPEGATTKAEAGRNHREAAVLQCSIVSPKNKNQEKENNSNE